VENIGFLIHMQLSGFWKTTEGEMQVNKIIGKKVVMFKVSIIFSKRMRSRGGFDICFKEVGFRHIFPWILLPFSYYAKAI
jgi:hypothetical protein